MEDRKLNEKESLELITRMIQNTKDRMAENSGTPFLLWGYVTVIISLLVWFLLKETGNNNWQFLWFLKSNKCLSLHVVESAEGSENVEDLHRPCCGLCVDGIWTGCFLGIVYRHICMEDSYSVWLALLMI